MALVKTRGEEWATFSSVHLFTCSCLMYKILLLWNMTVFAVHISVWFYILWFSTQLPWFLFYVLLEIFAKMQTKEAEDGREWRAVNYCTFFHWGEICTYIIALEREQLGTPIWNLLDATTRADWQTRVYMEDLWLGAMAKWKCFLFILYLPLRGKYLWNI